MITSNGQRIVCFGATIRDDGVYAEVCVMGGAMPQYIPLNLPDDEQRWVEIPSPFYGMQFAPKPEATSPIFLRFVDAYSYQNN